VLRAALRPRCSRRRGWRRMRCARQFACICDMGALALTSQPIGKLATLHARALSSESSEEASSHRERPPFTSRLDLLKLRRPAIDETDETRGRGAKTAVVSSTAAKTQGRGGVLAAPRRPRAVRAVAAVETAVLAGPTQRDPRRAC
jgi:hypothetical protein